MFRLDRHSWVVLVVEETLVVLAWAFLLLVRQPEYGVDYYANPARPWLWWNNCLRLLSFGLTSA